MNLYSDYTVPCIDFMGQKETYHKIDLQNGAMKNSLDLNLSIQGIVGCTPTNVPLWEIPI